MIFLSSASADPDGSIILRHLRSKPGYDSTARISRSKTLDGGSAVSHYGVSSADRELQIECWLSSSEFLKIKSFHENAILMVVSYWEGVYSGYIYRVRNNGGDAQIIIYIKEKLA